MAGRPSQVGAVTPAVPPVGSRVGGYWVWTVPLAVSADSTASAHESLACVTSEHPGILDAASYMGLKLSRLREGLGCMVRVLGKVPKVPIEYGLQPVPHLALEDTRHSWLSQGDSRALFRNLGTGSIVS